MQTRVMAPSPIAKALLSLSERRAKGAVDIGGRTLLLRDGSVLEIRAAAEDVSFEQFLLEAGLLQSVEYESAQLAAQKESCSVEDILKRPTSLGPEAVNKARRALFLDRLVRGIEADELSGRVPALLAPDPALWDQKNESLELLPLLLDAFSRRANVSDAEAVGLHAHFEFEWMNTSHLQASIRWLGLGPLPERRRVSTLLSRDPSAASKIAALIRAGLARILHPRHTAPPPAPRPPSIAPPPPPPRDTMRPEINTPKSISERPTYSSKHGALEPEGLRFRRWPDFAERLNDPLETMERRLAGLEQENADGRTRAKAWKELASLWFLHFDCMEEALRAYREASAADPSDVEALERCFRLCARLGHHSLALDYAKTWCAALPSGKTRAEALRALAAHARRTGDMAQALDALDAALQEQPEHLDARELLCRWLADVQDRASLWNHGQVLLKAVQEVDPLRAAGMACFLHANCNLPVQTSEALSKIWMARGPSEAAYAILADSARECADDKTRQLLIRQAVTCAEQSARADLAIEVLFQDWDTSTEPEFWIESLIQNLNQAGQSMFAAIVCEEMAQRTAPARRAHWLERAALAWAALPYGAAWAAHCWTEALIAQPASNTALRAMEEHAQNTEDPLWLIEAFERVLRANHSRTGQGLAPIARLMVERAQLLGELGKTAWALQWLSEHDSEAEWKEKLQTVQSQLRTEEPLRLAAEKELAQAAEEERLELARRLFILLRHDPRHAHRALELGKQCLEKEPHNRFLALAVERLLWAEQRDEEYIAWLQHQAASATSTRETVRLLSRAAALHFLNGDYAALQPLCLRILELSAAHNEATFRLERSLRLQNERALLRRLYLHMASITLEPYERAKAWMFLARDRELAGNHGAAVVRAEQVLIADPRHAEAALILLRHTDHIAPDHKLEVLRKIRKAIGETPELLGEWIQVAKHTDQPDLVVEACETAARLSPWDSEVALRRLEVFSEQGDVARIESALRQVWVPERITLATSSVVTRALHRIEKEAGPKAAATLALQALDALGVHDAELRTHTLRWAQQAHDDALNVAALERWIGACRGAARLDPLRQLATVYRTRTDRAKEARVLLRILAVAPYDPHALDRLADLYAQSDERERLLAVLNLRLEAASNPKEQLDRILDLASACYAILHDAIQAERWIRSVLPALAHDHELFMRAIEALVALGFTKAAVEEIVLLAQRSEPKQASRLLQTALQLGQEHPDPSLAFWLCEEGLKHFPGDSRLLSAFERLAMEQSDVGRLERVYEQLLEQSVGSHAELAILFRLGRFLEQMDEVAAAIRAYQRAFERDPQSQALQTALLRLGVQSNSTNSAPNLASHEAAEPVQRDVRVWCEKLQYEPWDTTSWNALGRLKSNETHEALIALSESLIGLWENSKDAPQDSKSNELQVLIKNLYESAHGPSAGLDILAHLIEHGWFSAFAFAQGAAAHSEHAETPAPLSVLTEEFSQRLQTPPLNLRLGAPSGPVPMQLRLSNPPTLVLDQALATITERTRFWLGWGLESAKPQHILFSVMAQAELKELLESVYAAWGPAEEHAALPRQTAHMAQKLWKTLPVASQRTLRDWVLSVSEAELEESYLRNIVELRAAWAGLALSTSLRTALRELCTLSDASLGPELSEADFTRVCQASPLLQTVLRQLLSEVMTQPL